MRDVLWVRAQQGRREEAAASYRRASGLRPDDVYARYTLGAVVVGDVTSMTPLSYLPEYLDRSRWI
ncbi:MAG: tetratricopeptide repeat protein [Gammaproteobacteria bacterium]|nr:tetratricopeptide repeat protein [Gammaproteobacteria bacterium]NIR82511.1 tetratricopeptide repeat protein [Gammaproteobacteria bacterium]NIU03642.1 tetratricopeptide repeat protein [Gammaproteobacteria bacterium]NIX84916.1 tetratricopeptide repeat protein [Gammaproteobacteria bacterium]